MNTIRFQLKEKSIDVSRESIRNIMSGLQRVTVSLKTIQGDVIFQSISTKAEEDQQRIYEALGIDSNPVGRRQRVVSGNLMELQRQTSWLKNANLSKFNTIPNHHHEDSLAFVEIDTVHHLKVGLKYQYVQLLKIEYSDEKISRVTTYVTYPPGGLRGFFRCGVSIIWRAKRMMHCAPCKQKP